MKIKLKNLLLFLLLVSLNARAKTSEKTLVEVWSGGDDGLTLRLRDALESAFKSSQEFSLSSGKTPGTLVVTIPTHVDWKKMGRRTQVFYTVEFASIDHQNITTSTGSCWDDRLAKCADQIVKDAKMATRASR